MANSTQRNAFLVVSCGGTARIATETFATFHQVDGSPFYKHVSYLDTEPVECQFADSNLCIGIRADEVDAIVADPSLHGELSLLMVKHYSDLLAKESIKNGSRTIRLLTQLAFEIHVMDIIRHFNRVIRDLIRSSGANRILPIFCSSTGGGAGSALTVLLCKLFANPDARVLMTRALNPEVLDVPIVAAVEPFAYAIKNNLKHADRILANAFAYRIETAILEREQAFQYAFHLGLANEGGAVFDTQDDICKGLGTLVYQLARSWADIKALFVNDIDTAKVRDRYAGIDVPEYRLPAELRPDYASATGKRRVRHRISLWNGKKHHA